MMVRPVKENHFRGLSNLEYGAIETILNKTIAKWNSARKTTTRKTKYDYSMSENFISTKSVPVFKKVKIRKNTKK